MHGLTPISSASAELDAAAIAVQIVTEIRRAAPANTLEARALRRRWTAAASRWPGLFVLDFAFQLLEVHGQRFLPYELVRNHPDALSRVNVSVAERLGAGIASWGEVDMFATLIAGQAWRRGQIPDQAIHDWARRDDRWWRRAALVSTVPLNVRNQGGRGDPKRTLAICALLVDDRDDMVVKALSWALRELVGHDPAAVRTFLETHTTRLAARVTREVANKLHTGLKAPHRRS
jgi:hypothetical protein